VKRSILGTEEVEVLKMFFIVKDEHAGEFLGLEAATTGPEGKDKAQAGVLAPCVGEIDLAGHEFGGKIGAEVFVTN